MVRAWWTQSEGGGIQTWSKPEASTFRCGTQLEVNTVTRWSKSVADAVRHWMQTQTDWMQNQNLEPP